MFLVIFGCSTLLNTIHKRILFRLLPSLFPAYSLVFIRHIARYTPQTTAKQL